MDYYLLYYKKDNTIKETKYDDVIDNLYEAKASIPSKKEIAEYIKKGKNKSIITYLKSKGTEEIIHDIKVSVSKIEKKIPLYDSYKRNLFIINKDNVYNRVMYHNYRFPDNNLIKKLLKKKDAVKNLINSFSSTKSSSDINYKLVYKKISYEEEYNKLCLMLDFMNSYDIDTLMLTYVKVFYFYANEAGKNITVCEKPSFMSYYPHLKPYYTRSELINLALNMGLITADNKYYDDKALELLCEKVTKNDISSDIIIDHQEHIIKENKIGVIQYYSIQGSYFTNRYLRGLSHNNHYKNDILESIITSIWNLILKAPVFDKDYIVYRFIHDDGYLSHLNIGDVFIDPSFISTTRDPFYRAETYKFGFILVKIKIPGNVKGVGLCLESYSHFPEEQEIILPPQSALRLDKKDDNALYYHTDSMFASQIKTRYEFTLMPNLSAKSPNYAKRDTYNDNRIIDFVHLIKYDTGSIYERIQQFISENLNALNQFNTMIGNELYTLIFESYDSTNAYKKFYASTTNNGFALYTFKDDYIKFIIELGENENGSYMYVNYYFKYASVSNNKSIKDKDFIDFISKIAYYFDIKDIALYPDYVSCDTGADVVDDRTIKLYYGGNYCFDFYNYLTKKQKRFRNNELTINTSELKPGFNYEQLDKLKDTDPMVILRKDDRDEIYQLYTKTYKVYFDKSKYNLADFYIWLAENHCIFLKKFIKKMHRMYPVMNPFITDFYVIDPFRYLYNNDIAQGIAWADSDLTFKKKSSFESKIKELEAKNEYRIDNYRNERVPKFITQ